MTGHLPLGPGAEFDAVRALLAAWGPRARGIGDDGAVLDVPAGERLVVSTDVTVEAVHFRRGWLTAEEIGWRAAMAALSDLAAMGAAPLGLLLAVTVPAAWRDELGALAHGVGEAAARVDIPIVGGDVTDGDRLALTITVLGAAGRPVTRGGARVGDRIYVTGRLGGPGTAVEAWLGGRVPAPSARARFARPEARLRAGQWLAAHGATAMIDLSDGLAGDAAHIAAASGVRLALDADRLPCLEGCDAEAALRSGEEYELLVCAPTLDTAAFARTCEGVTLTEIGRVEPAAGVDGADGVLVSRGGLRLPAPGAHDHFAREIP